ncbi:hypothetical protein BDD12DRAFT_983526 [Trichophaea hybrida]|nr:hypothetical protein BDD12DRAFT_983526 [Trichophaea hybrida]
MSSSSPCPPLLLAVVYALLGYRLPSRALYPTAATTSLPSSSLTRRHLSVIDVYRGDSSPVSTRNSSIPGGNREWILCTLLVATLQYLLFATISRWVFEQESS